MIPRHMQIAFALLVVGALAMGWYIVRLKHREEEQAQRAEDLRHVAPPVKGTREQVTLVVAYDEEGVLRREKVEVVAPEEPAERAREVLRALLARYLDRPSPHPLEPGADIIRVYLVGSNLAVVDTTAKFAAGHRSGVLAESLTVASLLETLHANLPGVTRLKILVEGQERETLAGHADLMVVYELAQVRRMVGSLP